MATKKVHIDILARDKTRVALRGAQKGINNLKSSVLNLKVALAGIGGGLVARSFLNTARDIERLQVRLKFLFGSAEEGAKAFDKMAKFASKVPFSLGEIQQGAGVLSVVSKDADELAKVMELTGNVL
jgi:phage tail tape-measure protein